MNYYDRAGSRGHRHARVPARAEDQPAAFELALQWRETWRAEKKKEKEEKEKEAADTVVADKSGSEAAQRRARFAAAIARVELGRAYWDERRHRAGKRNAQRPPGGRRR